MDIHLGLALVLDVNLPSMASFQVSKNGHGLDIPCLQQKLSLFPNPNTGTAMKA